MDINRLKEELILSDLKAQNAGYLLDAAYEAMSKPGIHDELSYVNELLRGE